MARPKSPILCLFLSTARPNRPILPNKLILCLFLSTAKPNRHLLQSIDPSIFHKLLPTPSSDHLYLLPHTTHIQLAIWHKPPTSNRCPICRGSHQAHGHRSHHTHIHFAQFPLFLRTETEPHLPWVTSSPWPINYVGRQCNQPSPSRPAQRYYLINL